MNVRMFYAARCTVFNCYLFSMQVFRVAGEGLIKLLVLQVPLPRERWGLPCSLYYDLLIDLNSRMLLESTALLSFICLIP
jgi:hypothetical protein